MSYLRLCFGRVTPFNKAPPILRSLPSFEVRFIALFLTIYEFLHLNSSPHTGHFTFVTNNVTHFPSITYSSELRFVFFTTT